MSLIITGTSISRPLDQPGSTDLIEALGQGLSTNSCKVLFSCASCMMHFLSLVFTILKPSYLAMFIMGPAVSECKHPSLPHFLLLILSF